LREEKRIGLCCADLVRKKPDSQFCRPISSIFHLVCRQEVVCFGGICYALGNYCFDDFPYCVEECYWPPAEAVLLSSPISAARSPSRPGTVVESVLASDSPGPVWLESCTMVFRMQNPSVCRPVLALSTGLPALLLLSLATCSGVTWLSILTECIVVKCPLLDIVQRRICFREESFSEDVCLLAVWLRTAVTAAFCQRPYFFRVIGRLL
jgi:hypothetical protein